MRSPDSFCPGRRPSLAPDGVAGYSPCRERSSNGAKLEPGEVIPEPQGARLPPAGTSSRQRRRGPGSRRSLDSAVLPDPPPGRGPPGGARTAGHAGESSAAPAPPRARRPRPAVPPPLRAAQDPTALHAAGGATPPTSSPATPAAAGLHRAPHRPLAPLGLPGNRRSSATPGGPPAERSLRAAGEARPPVRGAIRSPAHPSERPQPRSCCPPCPQSGPLRGPERLPGQVVLISRELLEGFFHCLRPKILVGCSFQRAISLSLNPLFCNLNNRKEPDS